MLLLLVAELRRNGAGDDVRQLRGGGDGLLRPPLQDPPGDEGREPLLAVIPEDADELLFRIAVHHVRRGEGGALVHAHVQGGLELIGEAAAGLVQLMGGDAQIQKDPVHLVYAPLQEQGLHVEEVAVEGGEPVLEGGEPPLGCDESVPVPIDAEEPAVGRKEV